MRALYFTALSSLHVVAAWRLARRISPSDGAPQEAFGSSVSLGAGLLAVGAIGATNDTGATYIFSASSEWVQTQKLGSPADAAGDYFGDCVALSADGSTLAVTDLFAHDFVGAVYIYNRATNGSYVFAQEIVGAGKDENFGDALVLSADGSQLLVGASAAAANIGRVFSYERSSSSSSAAGAWSLAQTLAPPDGECCEAFGAALTLAAAGAGAEGVLAVSAPAKNSNVSAYEGAVYVWARGAGSGSQWALQAELVSGDTSGEHGSFGASVALNGAGTTLAVGWPGAAGSGAVVVYAGSSDGHSWAEVQMLQNTSTASLGGGVALSDDGLLLAAAFLVPVPGQPFPQGAVALFAASSPGGSFQQTATLVAPDGGAEDMFGGGALAIAAGGTAVAVGASSVGPQLHEGAVYVFEP